MEFQNNFKVSTLQIKDSNELKNKLKNVINELELLQNGLSNEKMFDSFKNTASLDSI